jgi:hypothetical protein
LNGIKFLNTNTKMPTICTQTPNAGLTKTQKSLRLKRKALQCAALQGPPPEHYAEATLNDSPVKPRCDYWSCLPDEIQEYILDIINPHLITDIKNRWQRVNSRVSACDTHLGSTAINLPTAKDVNAVPGHNVPGVPRPRSPGDWNYWNYLPLLSCYNFLTPKQLAIVRTQTNKSTNKDDHSVGRGGYGTVRDWRYGRDFLKSVEYIEQLRTKMLKRNPRITLARLCAEKSHLFHRKTDHSLFLCFNKIIGSHTFKDGFFRYSELPHTTSIVQNQVFLVDYSLFNFLSRTKQPELCQLNRIHDNVYGEDSSDGLYNNTPPLCFKFTDRKEILKILSNSKWWNGNVYSSKNIKQYKHASKKINGKNSVFTQLKYLLNNINIGENEPISVGTKQENTNFYVIQDDLWLNSLKPVKERTPNMKNVRGGRNSGFWFKDKFTTDHQLSSYMKSKPINEQRVNVLYDYLL